MARREDFEIEHRVVNGKDYYSFNVEYFGYYVAHTEREILNLRDVVKKQVEDKLAWIEEENQKYYARLAQEEERRALFLKALRKAKNADLLKAYISKVQQLIQNNKIYNMIAKGCTSEEIMKAFPNLNNRSLSRMISYYKHKK